MTTFNTTQEGNNAVDNILTNGRNKYNAGDQGSRDTRWVTITSGCNEYRFQFGSDGEWRYSQAFSYGNPSFTSGKACDASGFVVNADAGDALDAIWAKFAI
jgi:hypothetical protein